jgi:glyoxylase-like metal-dependent hydrolase (beta-lactamase superfamily II)
MASWVKPIEPFKVIDDINYVETDGLAIYLITTPEGHILIDTGVPEVTPQIKNNSQKLGIKVTDIKYILNTQAHFDHTGGFAEIKNESGAKLVVGERDEPLVMVRAVARTHARPRVRHCAITASFRDPELRYHAYSAPVRRAATHQLLLRRPEGCQNDTLALLATFADSPIMVIPSHFPTLTAGWIRS